MPDKINSRESFIVKHPLWIAIACFIFALFIHPKLFNIHMYFRSSAEQPIPMNFVSNFYLWTRNNYEVPENIVAGGHDQLKLTNFKSKKTYFIIHGFTRTGLDDWVIHLKNTLLWREDCNVISVDWESGSLTVGYYVITERVPLVGLDVKELLTFLKEGEYLSTNQMHLLGHSLGAHIAGFAGKYFNGTIKRITGLDPAGISFNSASASGRLDKTDASFVDVIHTHGCYSLLNHYTDCYGTFDNIGDADFWPNGGQYQPPCSARNKENNLKDSVPEASNCHHAMAYVYFTESIKYYTTTTKFLARKCPSYEFFNNGSCDCGYPPQYMGFNANSLISGIFYLNTSHYSPYALLEPKCYADQYSLLKISGLSVCFLIVIAGIHVMYSSLSGSKEKKEILKCDEMKKED